jgi:hypothetical protein
LRKLDHERIGRRRFLNLTGAAGAAAALAMGVDCTTAKELFNRLRSRFSRPEAAPPEHLRTLARLPPEGPSVPLETALNSRCTSDDDGRCELFHWGLFDTQSRLSPEQIAQVVGLVRVPRFTDRPVGLTAQGNILTFTVERGADETLMTWLMIESGMQQQALCLICAALGVGMVFENLGPKGRPLSEREHGCVRVRLDPMRPSYAGAFWTVTPPAGSRPWRRGSLPDPDRQGSRALLALLTQGRTANRQGVDLTEQSLSQVLWAARGRTPHLYKSRHWGMTIPTWGGEQHISCIYTVSSEAVCRYVNWRDDHPTHALEPIRLQGGQILRRLKPYGAEGDEVLVIAGNEDSPRALWEIGYQLLNMLLQSHSLDLHYQAVLFGHEPRAILQEAGVTGAQAAIAFRRSAMRPAADCGKASVRPSAKARGGSEPGAI